MNKNKRLIYISLLAAQGVVITMLERAIPFPFAFAPGAKLGLANIITLLAIFTLPYKDSFKVVWMRLLISTLLGGTLSTFLYSFAGAFLSYGGMLLVRLLGPTFGSEAGQHDRHQCDRWDSAQCRTVGDGESDRAIVQRHALLADPLRDRHLLRGRRRVGGELFAGARRDNPSVPVGGGR